MPAAMKYDPDNEALRDKARDELAKRQDDASRAWKYYDGEHDSQLITEPGEPDDNVVVNLFAMAVDRVKSFLFPAMPRLEIEELEETPDEDWLRDAWDENGGAMLLSEIVLNGCLHGHVFLKMAECDEDRDFPRILNLNPANVLAFWKADDVATVLWYEMHWRAGGMLYRQDIVKANGSWWLRDFEAEDPMAGIKHHQYGSTQEQSEQPKWIRTNEVEWPYELGPVVDWKHLSRPNYYYGKSEACNLALNDQANKKASDVSRILRYHASPKTVGTGFEATAVQETAIDNFWTVPNEQAKIFNLEMQSDLASSMAYLQFLKAIYLSERRVVLQTGDIKDFQRVTNLGIRALYMDQIAKNEELKLAYGQGIQQISRRLMMLGKKNFKAKPIIHWPDPLPTDPKESVDVLTAENALGIVSKETMARDRGRDWEEEKERMDEESQDSAGMMQRMMKDGGAGFTPDGRTSPPTPLQGGEGQNVDGTAWNGQA